MLRNLHRFLSLGLVVFIAGCDLVSVKGSGTIKSESRPVSGFKGVVLAGAGKVVIAQDDKESLTIDADDNLFEFITSEVKDGRLVLGVRSAMHFSPSRDIVYKVSAKNLNEIVLAGSGSIQADGINAESLQLSINGSGDVRADGTAGEQRISINGSGDYAGENLKGKRVTVVIAGSGDAVDAASDTLDVTVLGSGSIEYLGDPKVTQKMLGSGSVKKR